jgi:hypothetical protein
VEICYLLEAVVVRLLRGYLLLLVEAAVALEVRAQQPQLSGERAVMGLLAVVAGEHSAEPLELYQEEETGVVV